MKLALVLGKQKSTPIIQRLKGIKDNLDIDAFESIPEFIDNSLKRNSIYDRILVLSSKLTSAAQVDLYNYWSAVSKETCVVLLCKAGEDEVVARAFLEQFKTPVATAMLVNTTTVQIIAEAVLRPTAELSADYGIKDFLDVEVDEDEFVAPEPPKKEEPKPARNKTADTANKNGDKKKPEKRGLFSSLFGSKKKKEAEQPVQEEPLEESELEEQLEEIEPLQESYPEEPQYTEDFEPVEEYEEEMPVVDETQAIGGSYAVPEVESPQEYEPEQSIQPKKSKVINSSPSFVVNEEFDGALEELPKGDNDFEPETFNVDEDFSEEGVASYEDTEVHYTVSQAPTADESFDDISLGSDEEEYRKSTEAPKVVTQTVVREVVRNIATGDKLTTLNGVYTGRLKKIVIVTGDRGTGVTSTAFNLAKTLAKKVDVLYVDCDIDNHGILSYLDYSNFKNYENTHMNGVKLCKGSQAFDKCVISWDTNLYMLTSDYSCDATVDELRVASEVVAERADDFGVVVVDCPVEKLEYIPDLILTGQGVICVEGTKRGFMNMLCQFEKSALPTRYKRTLVSRGSLLVTKCNKHLDLNKLVSYIKAIYEPGEVNWLQQKPIAFNGTLKDELLNSILEG